jgi:hypothetical protein
MKHQTMEGAMGVKIAADGVEHVIAGTEMLVYVSVGLVVVVVVVVSIVFVVVVVVVAGV